MKFGVLNQGFLRREGKCRYVKCKRAIEATHGQNPQSLHLLGVPRIYRTHCKHLRRESMSNRLRVKIGPTSRRGGP
uniref:Uncharacterized protein n=1 Tax=Gossypium raimondii TaxID=29730 RepID=A0A0D2QRG6_GOSRA|nr:hypothetical protein B456_003G107000 [Gossypium raimondii]